MIKMMNDHIHSTQEYILMLQRSTEVVHCNMWYKVELRAKFRSQHAMKTIIILWRTLISFRHLQNSLPYIHDWPGNTLECELNGEQTLIFFLFRKASFSRRASASWSFPCGGQFRAAGAQSPFCGGQSPPGGAASAQPAAPVPYVLCLDG